jgi:hypothetical protein
VNLWISFEVEALLKGAFPKLVSPAPCKEAVRIVTLLRGNRPREEENLQITSSDDFSKLKIIKDCSRGYSAMRCDSTTTVMNDALRSRVDQMPRIAGKVGNRCESCTRT